MVKVRFAPSPTGAPHIGGLRTALMNYIFARSRKGVFALRIEDTDRKRLVDGSQDEIIASLAWAGLDIDEGPVVQSDRLPIYREHADKLIKDSKAYWCNCSEARLDSLRLKAEKMNMAYKYDRHCVNNPPAENDGAVVRFFMPADVEVEFEDLVYGKVRVISNELEDFVLIKSDGFPTYNFANVIDDYLMKISHVIRGAEFISSTPKFLMIYQSFGWAVPEFAHVPQITGADKAKLSKRHGAKSVLEYRDDGILPAALINFLALLGWHPKDDKELFSMDELIERFDIRDVQKSPAVADFEKLLWFNSEYLKNLKKKAALNWMKRGFAGNAAEDGKLFDIFELVKERVRNYDELRAQTEFFFAAPEVDAVLFKSAKSVDILEAAKGVLTTNDETAYRAASEDIGVPAGEFFMSVRIAVTGSKVSPPLLPTILILGADESANRIDRALLSLQNRA